MPPNNLNDIGRDISPRFQIGMSPERNTIDWHLPMNAKSLYESVASFCDESVYEIIWSF